MENYIIIFARQPCAVYHLFSYLSFVCFKILILLFLLSTGQGRPLSTSEALSYSSCEKETFSEYHHAWFTFKPFCLFWGNVLAYSAFRRVGKKEKMSELAQDHTQPITSSNFEWQVSIHCMPSPSVSQCWKSIAGLC